MYCIREKEEEKQHSRVLQSTYLPPLIEKTAKDSIYNLNHKCCTLKGTYKCLRILENGRVECIVIHFDQEIDLIL